MTKTHSMNGPVRISIPVIEGDVLGVRVFRGYAKLSDLARISKADVYDAVSNPQGTQRDLSPKHAREAYAYIANQKKAFWPEIFLCARDETVLKFASRDQDRHVGDLRIDVAAIRRAKAIKISRVDGNHRLYFADGHQDGLPPIDKLVSFCIAVGLTRDEEIGLFRDINNNQRRMNTSHLDKISIRLSDSELRKRSDPALYIADRLANDPRSPLHEMIYEGGRKMPGRFLTLRSVKTGISYMMSRPTKLNALDDPDAQLKVIENFFNALRKWEPKAWERPKDHLLLRGAGFWGVCFLGAEVSDRVLAKGQFSAVDMYRILSGGKKWDWSNKGDFQGLSGRGGAVKICDRITAEFVDEGGVSVKNLFKKIMDQH
jgi:DGQHR domain-containing protein